ncbi:hypothetical protein KAR48_09980 [bacterium]|nr:hypothetical protein [bacterium]
MKTHRKLLKNYQVKFLALVCALFLWLFVVTANEFYQTIEVPLTVRNLPEGNVIVDPIPEVVEVLLRGGGRDLLNLSARDKEFVLDLANEYSQKTFHLDFSMLRGIPVDMSVHPIQILGTDTVFVNTDKCIRRRLPVSSQLKISMLSGYTQVGAVRFLPDSIWVEGPAIVLDSLKFVRTVQQTFQNLVKDLSRPVGLLKTQSNIKYDCANVDFSVDVQRIGERMYTGIPLRVIHIPPHIKDVRVVPSTLSLTLHAGVDLLAGLNKKDITATIDYDKWCSGQSVNAFFTLPEWIIYYNAKPKIFELMIE